MQLTLLDSLPIVVAKLTYRGVSVDVPRALVDTGSATTVIDADIAGEVGIFCGPQDHWRMLRGVGGKERVFIRKVDRLAVGAHGLDDIELEFGEMNYGFDISAILGMNFLHAARAVIDLGRLELDIAT